MAENLGNWKDNIMIHVSGVRGDVIPIPLNEFPYLMNQLEKYGKNDPQYGENQMSVKLMKLSRRVMKLLYDGYEHVGGHCIKHTPLSPLDLAEINKDNVTIITTPSGGEFYLSKFDIIDCAKEHKPVIGYYLEPSELCKSYPESRSYLLHEESEIFL